MAKRKSQLQMKGLKGWGGKRRGSGRKNRSRTVNHMKREAFSGRQPLQITMKVKSGLPSLRTKRMHQAFQNALVKAKVHGLRVVHYTLETNHFHLFVECMSHDQLGIAMRSFGSSFGKAVRKAQGGKGSVFTGRYHLSVLRNPTQARNSLRYVLLNRFKHEKSHPDDNPFSSGRYFMEWRRLLRHKPVEKELVLAKPKLPAYLSEPKSWLAREGWQKGQIQVRPNWLA